MTTNQKEQTDYNYGRFRASEYRLDQFDGPEVGQPALDFKATTLDNREIHLSDFRGQIVVLETGSITCPQYVHRIAPMNRLARQYPEVVFLLLYVREAHPGSHIAEHRSLAEKTNLARRLIQAEAEYRQIVIDDLAGSAHRAYGSLPNMIYVIGADGRVLFRGDWNQQRTVAKVIQKVIKGEPVTGLRAGFRPIAPPVLLRVLHRAGWNALFDFFVSLPNLIGQHVKTAVRRKA
jgi:hypothetical protein